MVTNIFKTTSLNLATYLLVKNFDLLGKENVEGKIKRYAFVFHKNDQCQKIATNFITGRGGTVDVHRFLDAQKRLKTLLFEQSL